MATDDDSDVPETGGVFTFGKSKFADNSPSKFWVRNDQVVQVACGDEHTALVTDSGRIFTFGANDWSQLGLGDTKTRTKPSCIKSLKSEKVRVVACGRSSTYVATESGRLYSFGGNTENQLGQGIDDASVPKPALIKCDDLEGIQTKMLSAGADHAAVLTDDGRVYIWGGNSNGQLGLGSYDDVKVPTLLQIRDEVTCISCGYYHTALTTKSGDLYTFGESDDGKLGLGDDNMPKTNVPCKVTGIDGKVTWVACGGSHTVAITSTGKAYSFGEGSNGQLGHGNVQLSAVSPQEIISLRESRMKTASCGENHTALISDKGVLFTFGDGRHGKLALGEENFANQFKPSPCTRFGAFTVDKVACGGCHMLVLAKPKLQNGAASGSDSDKEASDDTDQPLHGKHSMLEALRKSEDLSLSGSFSARNRRREKQDSQTGNSLSRTLPPLNSSLAGARTLPPLGSSGSAAPENPLNRSMLPPVRKPAVTSRKKTRFMRRYENDHEKKDEESDQKHFEEGPIGRRKVEVKEAQEVKSLPPDELKPLPVPLPRGNLRLSPVPSPRMVKPIREAHSTESEEDSEEPRRKPVTATRVSDAKSSPVPRPRLDRRKIKQKEESEDDSEEDSDEKSRNKREKDSNKPAMKKRQPNSQESESEEEEESWRKKDNKGKRSARKRGGPFGRKKLLDSEEEEEEEDSESQESEKDNRNKKKKEDSEEESEEESDDKKKSANKKSKSKNQSSEEEEEVEKDEKDKDQKEEEEKKNDEKEEKKPEKKSKLCTIL